MINLRPEICKCIREARRAAKLSQSVLAAEVGCKQSAISMFEQGDGTKLNDEVIERLAKKFGISLEDCKADEQNLNPVAVPLIRQPEEIVRGFCPNPHCPTNHRYSVEDRVFLLPDREKADPVGGKFCAHCGEILEKRCPNCGALIHDGAVCSHCGEPYIVVV